MAVVVVGSQRTGRLARRLRAGRRRRTRPAEGPAGPLRQRARLRSRRAVHLPAHRGLRRRRAVPRRPRRHRELLPVPLERDGAGFAGALRPPLLLDRRRRDLPPVRGGRRDRLAGARRGRDPPPGAQRGGAGPAGAGRRAGARVRCSATRSRRASERAPRPLSRRGRPRSPTPQSRWRPTSSKAASRAGPCS